MRGPCRPPIYLEHALDEPGRVRELVEQTAPHLPVQRYFKSAAEMRSQSGPGEAGAMLIAPNFRGDWFTHDIHIEGVAPILENPKFIEAAGKLFGSQPCASASRGRPTSIAAPNNSAPTKPDAAASISMPSSTVSVMTCEVGRLPSRRPPNPCTTNPSSCS